MSALAVGAAGTFIVCGQKRTDETIPPSYYYLPFFIQDIQVGVRKNIIIMVDPQMKLKKKFIKHFKMILCDASLTVLMSAQAEAHP